MSKFELKLPRMGESVAEATLTTWLKEIGDTIEMDEAVFEIATDKVDSEVPSEVEGILVEKCHQVDDVVKVGDVVAIIETESEGAVAVHDEAPATVDGKEVVAMAEEAEAAVQQAQETVAGPTLAHTDTDRFYSPLVKNIAREENISLQELEAIEGTGLEGRVTKNDILSYVERRKSAGTSHKTVPRPAADLEPKTVVPEPVVPAQGTGAPKEVPAAVPTRGQDSGSVDKGLSNGEEAMPMTRMGKLIAKHMTDSVATSAHVQSFIEVDVTNIVNWRNKVKTSFQEREGEKLTFTPIFMEAVAKALKKYPMMNISVKGDTVIKKKHINIGMAAALPDGNLIVPVIKNADQLNLVGMAKVVNDLATRARNNALKPDEVQDGTYTVTNVGTFGSVFGTPIINQPQVGILALGAIRKIPSVIETPEGDFIGVRSKMYLSHSYDHRVVNGALGSMFAKAVADYLEAWEMDREA
ncbi:dihydrolipoamide acetyltransferase family protein [Maribacter sp. 2307ULW6-5]|uniref:dihydrolipoamide acetyltransferase family protein n=1 Tax=Maribacter sp. 2307ULW6-5 TaxID=3386275 RepID=UPI0039BD303E